jgi:hypothetical protein
MSIIDQDQVKGDNNIIKYGIWQGGTIDTVYTVYRFKLASVVSWKDWQTNCYVFIATKLRHTVFESYY